MHARRLDPDVVEYVLVPDRTQSPEPSLTANTLMAVSRTSRAGLKKGGRGLNLQYTTHAKLVVLAPKCEMENVIN